MAMGQVSPMTSLALSQSLAAVKPAPGRNLASCNSSHLLSLLLDTEENLQDSLSLLDERREDTALFLSNSDSFIAVVSVYRRASYGVVLIKLSEKSSKNRNFLQRLATLRSEMEGGVPELEEEAGSLQLFEPPADLSASSLCAVLAPLSASLSASLSRASGSPVKKCSCHFFVNGHALI